MGSALALAGLGAPGRKAKREEKARQLEEAKAAEAAAAAAEAVAVEKAATDKLVAEEEAAAKAFKTTGAKRKRAGRAALISTTPQGVLGEPLTGRRRLSAT